MKLKKKLELLALIAKKRCAYCLSTENLTLDHKNPVIKGGTDDIKNIHVLCHRCNGIKSDHSHGTIQHLFRWMYSVNKARAAKGKRPLGIRNKDL